MNKHEIAIYAVICDIDPGCKCPLINVYYGSWQDMSGFEISDTMAKVILCDHLHTRLEEHASRAGVDGEYFSIMMLNGKWVTEFCGTERLYCGRSKLRALLVAHAVRLQIGVPKEICKRKVGYRVLWQ